MNSLNGPYLSPIAGTGHISTTQTVEEEGLPARIRHLMIQPTTGELPRASLLATYPHSPSVLIPTPIAPTAVNSRTPVAGEKRALPAAAEDHMVRQEGLQKRLTLNFVILSEPSRASAKVSRTVEVPKRYYVDGTEWTCRKFSKGVCTKDRSLEVRLGPEGPQTLCNACGLRWSRTAKPEDKKNAALLITKPVMFLDKPLSTQREMQELKTNPETANSFIEFDHKVSTNFYL